MRHKHAEIVEEPNPVKRQSSASHDATHDTRNQLRRRRSFASTTVATEKGRETNGDRTRDSRNHNPVLYQLSYGLRERGKILETGGAGQREESWACANGLLLSDASTRLDPRVVR